VNRTIQPPFVASERLVLPRSVPVRLSTTALAASFRVRRVNSSPRLFTERSREAV
jgi:hypothetical protein